jgi:hypothetical protein
MNRVPITDNGHWKSMWDKIASDTEYRFEPGEYEKIAVANGQFRNLHLVAADPLDRPKIMCIDRDNGRRIKHGIWIKGTVLSGLRISGFDVHRASENGIQVTSGGTGGVVTDVTIEDCGIYDTGSAFSNHDALKMTQVAGFRVHRVVAGPRDGSHGWGATGSGIDCVACHNGDVRNCRFEQNRTPPAKGNGQGVQCKGGSSDITIIRNRFVRCAKAIGFGGGQSNGTQWHVKVPLSEAAYSDDVIRAYDAMVASAPRSASLIDAAENVIEQCAVAWRFQSAWRCSADDNLVLDPRLHVVEWWRQPDPGIHPSIGCISEGNRIEHNLPWDSLVWVAGDDDTDHSGTVFHGNEWYDIDGATRHHWPAYPAAALVTDRYGIERDIDPDTWPVELDDREGLPYRDPRQVPSPVPRPGPQPGPVGGGHWIVTVGDQSFRVRVDRAGATETL